MQAMTRQTWEVPVGTKPDIKQMAVGGHARGQATYILPALWTLHLFQRAVEVRIEGALFRLGPGQLLLVPPNLANHYYFPGQPNHYYFAHFELPACAAPGCTSLPAAVDLGGDFPRWEADYLEAIQIFSEDKLRAEIRLWDMLLRLQDAMTSASPKVVGAPSLQKAVRLIELRLTEPIAIAALAVEVGVSHNHLIRLFQQRYQQTVQAYIRRRRLQRAQHLFRYTTRSVKSIAVEVGIANLQLFNKSIRREFGCAPRQLRAVK